MEITVKLFSDSRGQVVRIPKVFHFEGVTEVTLRKNGDNLILVPARKSWETFADEAPPVDDKFLTERPEFTGEAKA